MSEGIGTGGDLGFSSTMERKRSPLPPTGSASDEDGLTLGSLFRLKKYKVSKKLESAGHEAPAISQPAKAVEKEKEKQGDVENTLGNLTVKRKDPERPRDAGNQSKGERESSSIPKRSTDGKKKNEDSLSFFLKKMQFVSEARARKRKNTEDPCTAVTESPMAAPRPDVTEGERWVVNRRGGRSARRPRKVEGGGVNKEESRSAPLLAPCSGSVAGDVASSCGSGKKPRGRPRKVAKEVNNGNSGMLLDGRPDSFEGGFGFAGDKALEICIVSHGESISDHLHSMDINEETVGENKGDTNGCSHDAGVGYADDEALESCIISQGERVSHSPSIMEINEEALGEDKRDTDVRSHEDGFGSAADKALESCIVSQGEMISYGLSCTDINEEAVVEDKGDTDGGSYEGGFGSESNKALESSMVNQGEWISHSLSHNEMNEKAVGEDKGDTNGSSYDGGFGSAVDKAVENSFVSEGERISHRLPIMEINEEAVYEDKGDTDGCSYEGGFSSAADKTLENCIVSQGERISHDPHGTEFNEEALGEDKGDANGGSYEGGFGSAADEAVENCIVSQGKWISHGLPSTEINGEALGEDKGDANGERLEEYKGARYYSSRRKVPEKSAIPSIRNLNETLDVSALDAVYKFPICETEAIFVNARHDGEAFGMSAEKTLKSELPSVCQGFMSSNHDKQLSESSSDVPEKSVSPSSNLNETLDDVALDAVDKYSICGTEAKFVNYSVDFCMSPENNLKSEILSVHHSPMVTKHNKQLGETPSVLLDKYSSLSINNSDVILDGLVLDVVRKYPVCDTEAKFVNATHDGETFVMSAENILKSELPSVQQAFMVSKHDNQLSESPICDTEDNFVNARHDGKAFCVPAEKHLKNELPSMQQTLMDCKHEKQLSETPSDTQNLLSMLNGIKEVECRSRHCSDAGMDNSMSIETVVETSTHIKKNNDCCDATPAPQVLAGVVPTSNAAASLSPKSVFNDLTNAFSHIQDSCSITVPEIFTEFSSFDHTPSQAGMDFEIHEKEHEVEVPLDHSLFNYCDQPSVGNTEKEDCLQMLSSLAYAELPSTTDTRCSKENKGCMDFINISIEKPSLLETRPSMENEGCNGFLEFSKKVCFISETSCAKENPESNELIDNSKEYSSLENRSSSHSLNPAMLDSTPFAIDEYKFFQGSQFENCIKVGGGIDRDGLNSQHKEGPTSVLSQDTSYATQMNELEFVDKLPPSSGSSVSFSSLTPDVVKQPAFVSTSISELLHATGDKQYQSVDGLAILDKSSIVAGQQQSHSCIGQDHIEISCFDEPFLQTSTACLDVSDAVDATTSLSDHDSSVKQLLTSRASRVVKKRRHCDMAYEGDADWDVLTHEHGLFSNISSGGDHSADMKISPDPDSDFLRGIADGGLAAVAAGLKAFAAGPMEKIKFKEVLKRKGGLQEYLDCRNFILWRWSKDVNHILHLVDCGLSDCLCKDEPTSQSLMREIFVFLDQYGYINTGIASENAKQESITASLKVSDQLLLKGTHELDFSRTKDEVDTVVDQVKGYGSICFETTYVSETDMTTPKLDTGSRLDCGTEIKLEEHSCSVKSGVQPVLTASETKIHVENDAGGGICMDLKYATEIEYPDHGFIDERAYSQDVHEEFLAKLDLPPADPFPNSVPYLTAGSLNQRGELCQVSGADRDKVVCAQTTGTSTGIRSSKKSSSISSSCESKKQVIVIGAGPSGLTAARHLQRQGFSVIVLEARDRVGGRVFTDRSSLSVPVDLGASIITGVEADVTTERRADPSSLICAQLGLELTVLNSDCPLYDIVTGQKVPADLDESLEAEYNSLLDDMVVYVSEHADSATKMSLEDGLEYALKRRRMAPYLKSVTSEQGDHDKLTCNPGTINTGISSIDPEISIRIENAYETTDALSPLERRVMDWHLANLEYGCAAVLKDVSLPYWNQDDVYGGFGGAHCMIKGGYGTVMESLGKDLDIHLNHVVTDISYGLIDCDGKGQKESKVQVRTTNGKEFEGHAILVTVPLGCLKAKDIKFSPELPEWKWSSIQRLGFGVLNKVVLEFPEVFWDDAVDYFGATAGETSCRGRCFMFWNVKKTVGAPVLIALVVGKAAIDGQNISSSDHVNHALIVLRKLFGEISVPDPISYVVTNWGVDPFSRGAYSYVAIGASGEDYDILGRPISNCLFFAGEATCKEHPDTVGGAMLSGLREAIRMIGIFRTGKDCVAEIEVLEAVQRKSEAERTEVRDMSRKIEACKSSSIIPKDALAPSPPKEALLKELFTNAKTTSGRLHLAKELMRLPVGTLKSFAGTREGLSLLNAWILDSLGKNATQLLRHCVRILVLVSTNLLAVRFSGIGRTVKEKVCMHTSRDIRAIASQLVGMWIEVFRKKKAANGGSGLLKQTSTLESSKPRSKDLISGKLPQRMTNEVRDRGKLLAYAGRHSPSKTACKKSDGRPHKSELQTEQKASIKSLASHSTVKCLDSKVEGTIISKEESSVFAAAEAARNAVLVAAQAYAFSETNTNVPDLPKILSFHKFARREQYGQMDDEDLGRKCSDGDHVKQDCLSEIDSRNCKVRNWSVDFTDTCANLDSSKISGNNYPQQSQSIEISCPVIPKEHSGESGTNSRLTKAWVDTDSAGNGGVKDSLAIERWQSQALDANSDLFDSVHLRDEENLNRVIKLQPSKNQRQTEESSVSQVAENKSSVEGNLRRAGNIKQGVVDYVASLLMPLYKVGKIDKEGYKSIMRKTATKVMDMSTEIEKTMAIHDFLDFRRKNKIRSYVDKLIERHMEMTSKAKS